MIKNGDVPVHDDRLFFEFLLLEGAQAGLSWSTILKKRENYRAAFDNFDPKKIAGYGEDKIQQLLQNPGIVRNRAKVRSAVTNARAVLEVQDEFGSFDTYIWRFVGGRDHTQRLGKLSGRAGQDERSRSHEQRSQEPRVQVCGTNDLLCIYASYRDGQ